MAHTRILIVDDEEVMRDSLSDWLREDGYDVVAVESGAEAIEKVKAEAWNTLLVDLKMPGMDGIEVVRQVKKISPELPMIMITAYATVDTAVQAMKEGAYDYIAKPFDPEQVGLTIRKIIAHQELLEENVALRQALRKKHEFQNLIGKSRKIQEIMETVQTIADSNANVLITGESGTGKEVVARAIHQASFRRERPFVAVSCAAIPETLLASELFGYEKGAFTGATAQKRGRLEQAEDGTIFFDEIGDMSLGTQVDLLRVLQEREFRRVGGEVLVRLEARVISATNKNLKKLVQDGKFREDLYYRLNVIPIYVPPLRERKEDISLLALHFLKKFSVENGKHLTDFSPEAMELLLKHDWPGNVRELENSVERAVIVASGSLVQAENLTLETDLGPRGGTGVFFSSEGSSLEEVEKVHILRVLKANDWNVKKSSEILGIDRTTLYKKMREYGVEKVKEE
jgi:DNA-binding NtrC family response regulator